MTDTPTRAEFDALTASVAALAGRTDAVATDLAETKEFTGCTDKVNADRDRAARDFIAWWTGEDGRRWREAINTAIDWQRREEQARQMARDDAQASRDKRLSVQIGIAALVGIVTVAQYVGGWVLHALRGVTGGAP